MAKIIYDSDSGLSGTPCDCGATSFELMFFGNVSKVNFLVTCPKCEGTWWIKGLREVMVSEVLS